ncbi:hypothetical protein AGLY_011754 [Aphis glycines]|uniref:Uncharacterized protein n=1 Tax=Aphis glycines TaxID=307491 RepID=A0A6G0TC13_APHGL|nr:hypothetical protein AGLY_011754 [Aphis glycines]
MQTYDLTSPPPPPINSSRAHIFSLFADNAFGHVCILTIYCKKKKIMANGNRRRNGTCDMISSIIIVELHKSIRAHNFNGPLNCLITCFPFIKGTVCEKRLKKFSLNIYLSSLFGIVIISWPSFCSFLFSQRTLFFYYYLFFLDHSAGKQLNSSLSMFIFRIHFTRVIRLCVYLLYDIYVIRLHSYDILKESTIRK